MASIFKNICARGCQCAGIKLCSVMLDKILAQMLYSAPKNEKNKIQFVHVFVSVFGFCMYMYVKAFIGFKAFYFFVSVYRWNGPQTNLS